MFYDKRKDFYMGFRDLRYFIDLVESESYHATAQKNQVTQPSASWSKGRKKNAGSS
jgi:hypothetical protein